jgi:hypothetical protein
LSPAGPEEGRIQREDGVGDQSLAPGEGKTEIRNTIRPVLINVPAGSEDDIVSVHPNRQLSFRVRQVAEGEVVSDAQKRERQKIPHQLPTLLPMVCNPINRQERGKGIDCLLLHVRRNVSPLSHDSLQYGPTNVDIKVISGRLIIPANKHLAFFSPEPFKSSRFRFATKKPILTREVVVDEFVQWTEKDTRSGALRNQAPLIRPDRSDVATEINLDGI